jgi:hypothetical protein
LKACAQAAAEQFDMTLHGDNSSISCHAAILVQSMPLLARLPSFSNILLPGFTQGELRVLVTFAYSAGHR